MVTGIAIIAVIQHHTGAVDPGLVGLAISYALGITGKLSGLVSGTYITRTGIHAMWMNFKTYASLYSIH